MTLTYILRVWMPDRPGALGQVASRVGAVARIVEGNCVMRENGSIPVIVPAPTA